MIRNIKLNNQEIKYAIRRSARAKRARLTVYGDGNIFVTLPRWAGEQEAENFVKQKLDWLAGKIDFFKNHVGKKLVKDGRADYLKNKERAGILVKQKIEEFNKLYNFRYAKISIRNQKSRWGSCSRKGNLNFNYRLVYLPEDLADYIIAHELCHLKEMNHGKKFWELVGLTIPRYSEVRRELRRKSLVLI